MGMPRAITKAIEELYNFASQCQGGRHAGTGGHVPDDRDAEWTIHTAAAAIQYAATWAKKGV